jgi:hypothetical protein
MAVLTVRMPEDRHSSILYFATAGLLVAIES